MLLFVPLFLICQARVVSSKASDLGFAISETPAYTSRAGPAELSMCEGPSDSGPAALSHGLSAQEKDRLYKLTDRYSRKRYLKPLVKYQLQKKESFLRRFLGNVGQDPSNDDLHTGTVDIYKTVPIDFVKALNNVAGETSSILGYLWAFGYIPKVTNKKQGANSKKSKRSLVGTGPDDLTQPDSLIDPCAISDAVKEFQKFNGIEPTGMLDTETMKRFKKSRCGIADVGCTKCKSKKSRRKTKIRPKRYALRKRKWKNFKNLRYFIQNCTIPSLSVTVCRQEIAAGLGKWTDIAPLVFQETSDINQADIILYFVRGQHKNDVPFDGPGGVLGHAYFPRGGHVHYDLDEHFTANSRSGINLQFVTAHEIGHVLGLMHTMVDKSVMNPQYNEGARVEELLRLSWDDRAAIIANYGSGKGRVITLDD